jgi:hypothetical protein
MFNTKLIEDFYKNISGLQLQFVNNYKNLSNLIEENNKKAKEYWDGQYKAFNTNILLEKLDEFNKINEENYSKAKAYIANNSQILNGEKFLAQIKQVTKTTEENNLKNFKQLEKNICLVSSEELFEQVEKVTKSVEENQKKIVAYFEEQYEFLKTFQTELVKSMQSENPVKDFPEVVTKYSKVVTKANLKKIDENLDTIKKVVN